MKLAISARTVAMANLTRGAFQAIKRQRKGDAKRNLARLSFCLGLCGCAASPTGPDYKEVVLPQPDTTQARVVVFRDYAEPTAYASTVLVDGEVLFQLVQKSFGYVVLPAGEHSLQLKWRGGMPGWQDQVDLEAGTTYYYQVEGVSGIWVFHSRLESRPADWATATLQSCCKLVDELKDSTRLRAVAP